MKLSKKDKVKVAIGVVAIAVIALFSLFGQALLFRGWGFPGIEGSKTAVRFADLGDWEVLQAKEFPADEVRSLDMDMRGCDVKVVPGKAAMVRVIEEARLPKDDDEARPATVEVLDGTLAVEVPDFGSYGTSLDVLFWTGDSGSWMRRYTVEVPEELADELQRVRVDGVSDSMEIRDLACDELSLTGTSGTWRIGADAGYLSLNLTSGDVVYSGAVSERMDVKMTAGDVELTCEELPSSASVKMTSGTAWMNVPEESGFTVRVYKTSSSFTSDLELAPVSGDEGVADLDLENGTYRYGDGSAEMTFELSSGSVRLSGI